MKKSIKLAIFFEDLVLGQESSNNENKNNEFFENKFDKEATKRRQKTRSAKAKITNSLSKIKSKKKRRSLRQERNARATSKN
jgi:hypothetical protein